MEEQDDAQVLMPEDTQPNENLSQITFTTDLENININEVPIVFCNTKEVEIINENTTMLCNLEIETIDNERKTEENAGMVGIMPTQKTLKLNTNTNNVDNTIRTSECLGSHLSWPVTPERKGKKNVERLPFVLTSSDRQNMEKEKAERKLKEERLKKERQAERMKKKEIQKSKTKIKNDLKMTNKTKTKQNHLNVLYKNQLEKENTTDEPIEIESVILKKGVKVHLPVSNNKSDTVKTSPVGNKQISSSQSLDLAKRILFKDDIDDGAKKSKSFQMNCSVLVVP